MIGDDAKMTTEKKYERPFLRVENFNVVDYISACSVLATVSSSLNCAKPSDKFLDLVNIYIDYPEVFTNACEVPFEDFEFEGICLHTPNGTDVVFSS